MGILLCFKFYVFLFVLTFTSVQAYSRPPLVVREFGQPQEFPRCSIYPISKEDVSDNQPYLIMFNMGERFVSSVKTTEAKLLNALNAGNTSRTLDQELNELAFSNTDYDLSEVQDGGTLVLFWHSKEVYYISFYSPGHPVPSGILPSEFSAKIHNLYQLYNNSPKKNRRTF